MPFESQAQRRWMYANEPEIAKKWSEHTPKGKKLPEYVKQKEAHMTTEQAYINGFVKRANEHGFTDNEAVKILKQASPQSAASFMENYKAMPPAGQQNLATNPNVNPVAHQQMLSGMNWQGQPMMDKAKALFTPGHTQNIANRAVRAGTGMARSLAGDNPANVAANFKQITAPQPNRAMLQAVK